MIKDIVVKGARVHNLKNIDITIPRDKLVVLTGLSGSGKSSLAFDTIYAEGQRRYVESLSAYARQFLGQMDKPDVDYIEGLSPAISIDQKTTSRNPRSTVGTVTEIYDYLRLLFARIGRPHCPRCGQPIQQQSLDQMLDQILGLPSASRLQILAPLVRGRKGEHAKLLEEIRKQGYVRVRIDGQIYDLNEPISLEKNKKHTIEVVVDRIVLKEGIRQRLADSLEVALKLGEGIAVVDVIDGEELTFSENFACIDCGISIEEIAPRLFSFNSPFGACPECTGLGQKMEIDPELVIPDPEKSIAEGAILPYSSTNQWMWQLLAAVSKHFGFDLHTPISRFTPEQKQVLLYGAPGQKIHWTFYSSYGRKHTMDSVWEGIIPNLERRYRESTSESVKAEIEEYMTTKPCPACQGARLKPEALAVLVGGKNIREVTDLSVEEALRFFEELALTEREQLIARQILKEIKARLGFLNNVGLDYLTLSRAAHTLSGGEAQRIRLATQIGSGLVGVLYILDEPSIGLHQRDNDRLLATLKQLRDLGNTLLVVEHDEDTILAADHVIDIGPGAGANGGEVVAQGTVAEIMANPRSLTGQYLSGKKRIPVPALRRPPNGKYLEIIGARENNLKNLNVRIPLGVFVCVTGVSGSGKSTLVNEILYKGVAAHLYRAKDKPGAHQEIRGLEHIDKVIDIDQSPIGRTPRSNPATYTGVFDAIREVFSQTPEARVRGYKAGRFSFNVKGGRCEACSGDGIIKIEMHFLPDVYVPCEVCKGKRYNRETLEVKYKGKTIADVLEMVVDEAVEFFQNIPKIHRKLKTLQDVGLGYIKLGQPATTLSGGEAQRVKLATELSRRSTGRTLYILDEPTTGLHMADVDKLLQVLHRLVENGDTVVVIEHNLDVIKTADYIIDLGPEGGNKGGEIIAQGTPEEVAAQPQSYTGQFLARLLARERQLA
ncbi:MULTISPECIES: excinuclease ABC subunit UvrA [unclassified Carboxydocella]|uniref:excinuclease ABC subunit UvrA n=1 Tax=unclassified Carboxydocella TaxID=2685367 RepID=UPI0009ADC4BE|nr:MULTISPECIES: excinuclease ABC subunit UvrA [unclassified Carboxydocella]GAW29291.1 excinuclease ABC subunit A [Carboxydocella sp. ULO1]GAW30757.1 excinuclease ABC subunit A [Carboxydocella sp. JDF658]